MITIVVGLSDIYHIREGIKRISSYAYYMGYITLWNALQNLKNGNYVDA